MITEYQQILACCQKHLFGEVTIYKVNGEPFSTPLSRMNHPVVKWARANKDNFSWLVMCLFWLYGEQHGKSNGFRNVPKNVDVLLDQAHCVDYNELEFINFAKASDKGLDFTHIECTFEAYDKFLKAQGA
jgi:hypothetical protein